MSRWDGLEDSAFVVPPVNLPAVALANLGPGEITRPLVDQTVWWLDTVDDGTVVGRALTNFGTGWDETTLFGTISDDGDVVFSFTPLEETSGGDTAPVTVGRGTMARLGGEWTFLMQMSSGTGLASVTHWAYMIEAGPGDANYAALPGYRDTSVPDLIPEAPPPAEPDGIPPPRPDPGAIAAWEALEDTYWYVPPINLPAQLLLAPGDTAETVGTLPLVDQTVWHIETVRDGYLVGRVMANVGAGWSEQIMVGSVTPGGAVSFSFTPAEGASLSPVDGVEVADIIVGLGEIVEVDGETAFLMQMNSGGGQGSVSHWAWMLQAHPDDAAWIALPGYPDTAIPDLFPDAPPAESTADSATPKPDPAQVAALAALEGTSWLTRRDSAFAVLEDPATAPMLEQQAVAAALSFDTIKDGYIVGTFALGRGEGWETFGVTGSLAPGGSLLLSLAGADGEPGPELLGEVRAAAERTVVDLQFAFGTDSEAVAAALTLLPASSGSRPVDPSGVKGATLAYLLEGAAATLRLTEAGNVFRGIAADEAVIGGAGADTITAGSGDDSLFGGGGEDVLNGGADTDRLTGGAGADRVAGGAGSDRLRGGDGSDTLEGGRGEDRLLGEKGGDALRGGPGADSLGGGSGDDVLYGGTGDDVIFGGAGADVLDGGPGRDRLHLGTDDGATDVVVASPGRDTVAAFEQGIDKLDLAAFAGREFSMTVQPFGTIVTLGDEAAVIVEGVPLAADDLVF